MTTQLVVDVEVRTAAEVIGATTREAVFANGADRRSLSDALPIGASRLAEAAHDRREQFVTDHIAIAERLIGFTGRTHTTESRTST
ncbi:hypothetical protein [Nocardia fluminea]|uniref:hypothetical protein n=1 Tax=Nocardia fluminea TaxID=134984 RepID=UPI00117F0296|nr:hypothetical protein [Nocardia fluminea]